jgi:hypothetical protein
MNNIIIQIFRKETLTKIVQESGRYSYVGQFNLFTYLIFIYLLVGLGFELRALLLQSRCSSAWATSPVHFVLVILVKQT